jgi:hypothetical protein
MRAIRRDIHLTLLPKTGPVFDVRQHAPSTLAIAVQS